MGNLKRADKSFKIISNKCLFDDYFELKIDIGNLSKSCNPGQFFMINVPGVFLRRPLSIYDVNKNMVSFLYKVVGKGTKLLSQIKNGEIEILGPLGCGYPLNNNLKHTNIIVAGGTGIVSVHYLAKMLKTGILYYGAKTKKDLICLDKFKKLGLKIIISTEDGSKGYKGFVTEILEKELKQTDVLYSCGPMPMLKAVAKIASSKKVKGYLSLEEKMACGFGNCQGCAVQIGNTTKMVCKDGPVFNIEEVKF